MTIRLFIFLLLILATCSCKKESPSNSFTNYTVFNTQNSGLPTNFATRIAIDNTNTIWVGTFDKGIAKYNGQQWTVYNTQNSPLPNDSILSLTVDKSNKLWIGTSGGLACLDHQTWTLYNASNSGFKVKYVLSLCTDSAGLIWAGGSSDTLNSGLYSFNGSAWQHYSQKNSLLPNDIITALAATSNSLLVGTAMWQGNGGFLKLQNGAWEFFNKGNSSLPYNTVDHIDVSQNGNILIASPVDVMLSMGPSMLSGYLLEVNKAGNWKNLSPANAGLHLTNRINAVCYDKQNNIWASTSPDYDCSDCSYALSKYDGQKWTVYSLPAGNLPKSFIPDIKADRNNNIWVAASDIGLIKITN